MGAHFFSLLHNYGVLKSAYKHDRTLLFPARKLNVKKRLHMYFQARIEILK